MVCGGGPLICGFLATLGPLHTTTTSLPPDRCCCTRLAPHSAEKPQFSLERVHASTNRRHRLVYTNGRWSKQRTNTPQRTSIAERAAASCQRRLSVALLPAGVTGTYLRYMRWRLIQRFCKSVLHVLGTTSLLMGLGITAATGNKKGAVAAAATSHWILKDVFGKAVRVLWASRMGPALDADAKRWRFRASLIFMVGGALEMACRLFPAGFIGLASAAKGAQQISMLTTSSTRTVFYQALSETNHNMGDVTAKGEAQIAIVSVVGMIAGIVLCRTAFVLAVYVALQMLELVAAYQQLRAVEFRTLNLERLQMLLDEFVVWMDANHTGIRNDEVLPHLSPPSTIARTERILRAAPQPPFRDHPGRASPDRLADALNAFRNEDFAIVNDGEAIIIFLREHANATAIAKSLLTHRIFQSAEHDAAAAAAAATSLAKANVQFPLFCEALQQAGWESPDMLLGSFPVRTEWTLDTDGSFDGKPLRS